MMGPRTAHERLQNPIFQLLKHLLSKKKMLKIGYIYIYIYIYIKGKLIEIAE
jgi:hypothetical protein